MEGANDNVRTKVDAERVREKALDDGHLFNAASRRTVRPSYAHLVNAGGVSFPARRSVNRARRWRERV